MTHTAPRSPLELLQGLEHHFSMVAGAALGRLPHSQFGYELTSEEKTAVALIEDQKKAFYEKLPALRASIEAREKAILEALPKSWLDPILSGPNQIAKPPYTGADIENIIRAIRRRISGIIAQPPAPPSGGKGEA